MKRKSIQTPLSFFSEQKIQAKVSSLPLAELKLNDAIEWEEFRGVLQTVRSDYSRGGRPPYDEVFMFKCLILQTLYNLSDEALEFEILNRISFRLFLGMNIESDVPDRNTIWHFREQLTKRNLLKPLFERFNEKLLQKGFIVHKGLISDATFVEAPRQRNTPEENRQIKQGKSSEEVFSERTAQSRNHKDADARWAFKGGERHYGYKDHVTIDESSKLIVMYKVTPSNVWDGTMLSEIIPPHAKGEQSVYADSGYSSTANTRMLKERGFTPEINEKGYRYVKLTDDQRRENARKSRTRSRVEHVFAEMTNFMKVLLVRTIGISRSETKIGLMNLTYNLRRYLVLIGR